MLTPLELETKEFKKTMRGYSEAEVNNFLDTLKADYENLYRENIELKDKLKAVTDQLSRYKTIEETLKETLIVAQKTAEDVNMNAQRKSDIIIEEAYSQAKKIIEDGNNQVVEIKKNYEDIRREFMFFKTKFRGLLEEEIQKIEEIFKSEEIKESHTELIKEKVEVSNNMEKQEKDPLEGIEE